jgi:hypothetical protein
MLALMREARSIVPDLVGYSLYVVPGNTIAFQLYLSLGFVHVRDDRGFHRMEAPRSAAD